MCYITHSRYGTGENLGALFARAAGKSMMVAVMRNGRGTAPQTRQSFSLCLALRPNCLCAAVRFLAMIFHVPMVASLSVYVCVCACLTINYCQNKNIVAIITFEERAICVGGFASECICNAMHLILFYTIAQINTA